MKANPKKKKKSKGKISPPPVPSEPIPPEWLDLVPDQAEITLSDIFNNAEESTAVIIGNKSSMEELINNAKKGDKKSFLNLIKINTFAHPFDDKEDSTLIIPSISADRDFYEQKWVQKILVKEMEDEEFRKDFWKAVFSRQNNTFYNRTTGAQADLKEYIVNRREKWNTELSQKSITFEQIRSELVKYKMIKEEDYTEIKSLTRFLNIFGVTGKSGRPKKAK
jgi:hypothetical protein